MPSVTRRSFLGHAAAVSAAIATPALAAAQAPVLFKPGDWKMASFQQLLQSSHDVKQLYDATIVDDGNALDHMVNSLNGLQFGFGIPADRIKLVGAFRAMATVLNYDDAAWEKYRIGEQQNIKDPKTGKPAIRNIFAASAAGSPPHYTSTDPDSDNSLYQDASISALQARGVQFLACHLAIHHHAKMLVTKLKLPQTPAEVERDLAAHLLPGVLVVPSMVSAIAMLQARGQFTYLRM